MQADGTPGNPSDPYGRLLQRLTTALGEADNLAQLSDKPTVEMDVRDLSPDELALISAYLASDRAWLGGWHGTAADWYQAPGLAPPFQRQPAFVGPGQGRSAVGARKKTDPALRLARKPREPLGFDPLRRCSMPLRYLLKQFFMPPGILLLLIALGWFLRRRFPRLALCCFTLGLGGLWLMSLPVTVEWMAKAIEREPAIAQQQWSTLAQQADVIVVLGGGRDSDDPAWGGEQPSAMALERTRYAARLAKASGLPVLTTGGLHFGRPPSEAALMAEVMREDLGVEVRWQEERSRTTWENATETAALLKPEGVRRVLLVTQAWHMPRSRWCFEQAGFEVVTAPVGFLGVPNGRPMGGWLPEGKAFWQSTLLLNEVIGALAYPLVYGR